MGGYIYVNNRQAVVHRLTHQYDEYRSKTDHVDEAHIAQQQLHRDSIVIRDLIQRVIVVVVVVVVVVAVSTAS